MKMRLIKPSVCPPDGFRYVFPDTGFVVHAWDHDSWIAKAGTHLQVNNLPHPANLEALMEEQLCQLLPPGWCSYDNPGRARVNPVLSWDDVKRGLATFSSWVAQGCRYVPQKEAERRALICSRCYFNLPVQGCAACHAAVKELSKALHTQYDSHLTACGVCKCLLKAKVHFPISNLDKGGAGLQELYPDHCWMKKGGSNYAG